MLGMLSQQGAHQGRLTGASRAPEQGMVGGHAIDELPGVAAQLFNLAVHADQVRQAHVEADLQRHQIAAAPVTLPAGGQGLGPIDGGPRRRQQRFDPGQHGIGTLKKSIQSRVHVFSSDRFTVMMALQQRNAVSNGGSTSHNTHRLHRYSEMISYA
ncbi:hypothetical protein D3C75_1070890 [compost metagenome]